MNPRRRPALEATFACSAVAFCFLLFGAISGPGSAAAPAHPAEAGDRIALSLRFLAAELAKKGTADLAGIGWLEGFVVEPEARDVILVGRGGPGYPTLHADDLVVAMRNIWGGGTYPYCSLDPQPQNVKAVGRLMSQGGVVRSTRQMHDFFAALKKAWGPQSVVVDGVPRNSRHAHIMIDADYHMKKLSQGLVKTEGVQSILDIAIEDATWNIKKGKASGAGVSMSRFWFHIGKGQPTFREGQDVVMLDQCAVIVLTGKQRADVDGVLSDAGGNDPHANLFARTVSNKIQSSGTAVPEYARLVNLYRLHAALRAMRFRDAAGRAKLDLGYYLREYKYRMESPMPASMPGLVSSKEEHGQMKRAGGLYEYVLFPLACGGVSMEMAVHEKRFQAAKAGDLNLFRRVVLAARPSARSVSWRVRSR